MKLTLTPNPDCKKCDGRGFYTKTDSNSMRCEWTISLHACTCVITRVSGPKKVERELLNAIFNPESAEEKLNI